MILELAKISKNHSKNLNWNLFISFDRNINWYDVFHEEELIIDMSGLTYIEIDGLVWLANIILIRTLNDLHTYVIPPLQDSLAAFVNYSGFSNLQNRFKFSYIHEERLYIDKFYEAKDSALKQLKGIRYVDGFSWRRIHNETKNDLQNYLCGFLKIDTISEDAYIRARPFTKSLFELIQNIAFHGGTDNNDGKGFVSLMQIKNSNKMKYCFSDSGNGFQATLLNKHKIKCKTEEDAIYEALLFRNNYKDDALIGLFPTLPLIRQRNGFLGIRSKNVLIEINFEDEINCEKFDLGYYSNPSKAWLKTISKNKVKGEICGTYIYIDLNTKQ